MKANGFSYVLLALCALSLGVMAFVVVRVNSMEFSGKTPYQGVSSLIKKSHQKMRTLKRVKKRAKSTHSNQKSRISV